MGRDLKFEIQYLLSLTLVIFGILSVEQFTSSIENWVGLIVILLLAVYFSVFTILYAFDRSMSIKIDFIDRMNDYARPILLVLSAAFSYFILHLIASVGYDVLILGTDFTSDRLQIVIKYAIPIVPVGLMTGVLNIFVVGPLNRYDDVNIKVIPRSIRVFPSASETQPLTIKIENNSDEEISWELSLEIPDDILLETNGGEYTGEFHQEGNLRPGRAFRKTSQLSHTAGTRRSDLIETHINLENGSRREEVELVLEV